MMKKMIPGLVMLLVASVAHGQKKVVLGQLGQVSEATSIQAAPNTKSRIYYKVKAFEYLVIKPAEQVGWRKVLLSNGMFGYVKSSLVAELPYQVTQTGAATPSRGGSATSRSGGRDAGVAITSYAQEFIGTPYVWGGNDERKGIDCSGFVKNMFGTFGAKLPRTAAEQALVGQPITKLEDLKPGDRLYFWSAKKGKIGHTGIYMGNGYFIHSSSGKKGVSTDYLGSPTWMKILYAARR